MIYYKIIAWGECSFCLKAKIELINRQKQFEYCVIDQSPELLNIYKSNYNYDTVPIILRNKPVDRSREVHWRVYRSYQVFPKKALLKAKFANLDGTRGI